MAVQCKQAVVAAIDFGTCNTRMAFGVRGPEKVNVRLVDNWENAPPDANQMVPTCILFNSKREIVAYGWEAEEKFREYTDKERDESFLFRNFKMTLHQKKVHRLHSCAYCCSHYLLAADELSTCTFNHAALFLECKAQD